jgi:signal peptidase I
MNDQNQTPGQTPGPGQDLTGSPTPPPAGDPPAPILSPLQSGDLTPRHDFDSPQVEAQGPSQLQSIAGGFTSVLGAIFSWVIFPIAIVLILHNFVFQAYHVVGTSMVPTLHDTDYLIISKLGYTQALVERVFGQNKLYIPKRGQIIVFRYPKDPTKVFVKRVVGLPGDHIVIKSGTVTIFNKEHPGGFNPDLSYEGANTTTLIDTDETVEPGNLFVMGDNRTPGGSYDSREWGELPSSYIIGNAVLRLLPLDQVRIM